MPELKGSLTAIRQASGELISAIDEKVKELTIKKAPETLEAKADKLADELDREIFVKPETPEPVKTNDAAEKDGSEKDSTSEKDIAADKDSAAEPQNEDKKPSVRKQIREAKAAERKAPMKTRKTIRKKEEAVI